MMFAPFINDMPIASMVFQPASTDMAQKSDSLALHPTLVYCIKAEARSSEA